MSKKVKKNVKNQALNLDGCKQPELGLKDLDEQIKQKQAELQALIKKNRT